jgi:hypothetical protein
MADKLPISRRDFMRVAGLSALGAAGAAVLNNNDREDDKEENPPQVESAKFGNAAIEKVTAQEVSKLKDTLGGEFDSVQFVPISVNIVHEGFANEGIDLGYPTDGSGKNEIVYTWYMNPDGGYDTTNEEAEKLLDSGFPIMGWKSGTNRKFVEKVSNGLRAVIGTIGEGDSVWNHSFVVALPVKENNGVMQFLPPVDEFSGEPEITIGSIRGNIGHEVLPSVQEKMKAMQETLKGDLAGTNYYPTQYFKVK